MPLLFSSPVLSHFILYSLPSSATVVLLSRSIPLHSLLSPPPVPLLFSSPVLIPFHFSTLFPPVPLLFSSPVLSHFILYSLSSATVVFLSRSIPFHSLSSLQRHCCFPLPFYPISFSTLFPSSATVVLLSRSLPFQPLFPPVPILFSSPVLIPFHSLLSPLHFHCCFPLRSITLHSLLSLSLQCHCCSPLPLYPISFSTLFPPLPLLFSSPVLSHFILYSLPSSATVVLLSRSNPISVSTLSPPVPLLFSSPVISHFIFYSLPSTATVVLLSRYIPFHSLLSSLQCHCCSPLPF